MGAYAQFCPVAKAAEVFDQRWTLLVLRELVAGSTRFDDLHRGLPRRSRTLLSRRLTQLERKGIVGRRETPEGPVYELTGAGRELLPVLVAIGERGVRWMSSLDEEDLDPAFLLWDVHRRIDHEALPRDCTVVALVFGDTVPELRYWWLLLTPDDVDICDEDPVSTPMCGSRPRRTPSSGCGAATSAGTRPWRGTGSGCRGRRRCAASCRPGSSSATSPACRGRCTAERRRTHHIVGGHCGPWNDVVARRPLRVDRPRRSQRNWRRTQEASPTVDERTTGAVIRAGNAGGRTRARKETRCRPRC